MLKAMVSGILTWFIRCSVEVQLVQANTVGLAQLVGCWML